MKFCSKCKDNKELTAFDELKTSKDGLRGQCKICRGIQKAIYQKTHFGQAKINVKRWLKTHPENKHLANASVRAWRKSNPDKVNALRAKRRASKLQRTPKWLTKEQLTKIEEFYTVANELSWLSEDGLHVDHIVPLQGENVSGLHVPWNLQVVPAKLNLSKGNKF